MHAKSASSLDVESYALGLPTRLMLSRGVLAAVEFTHRIKFCALAVLLASTASTVNAAQPQKFLTFDRSLTPASVQAHPNAYVYVWGASNPALTAAFTKYSPDTLLSAYYPYSRDPDAGHDSEYWKKIHPDWMAYSCDGKTAVKAYGDRNISLDITRPDVINWQIDNFLKLPSGMGAVALDNFQFNNDGHACGQMQSGHYAGRYTGTAHDAVFSEDAVRWLDKVSTALHAHDIKVTINHIPDLTSDGDDPSSPLVESMVKSVDGILDEHAQNALVNERQAALLAKFVSYVTAHGKWMYLLYQLNDADSGKVESAVANYLMMAGPKTAIYISQRDSTYGKAPDFMGFDRDVGDSCGLPTTQNGVMFRKYSRGLAIYAPVGQSPVSFSIPKGYQLANGSDAGVAIKLDGGHGRVLYTANEAGCGKQP